MKLTKYAALVAILFITSCAPYYAPPAYTPVLVEKPGDISCSFNGSVNLGAKEFGLKATVMAPKNMYLRFDWQKGSFEDYSSSFSGSNRGMDYQYNEFSAGYIKEEGKFRSLAGVYYGYGLHRLSYFPEYYAGTLIPGGSQSSRMQQVGVLAGVYYKSKRKLLLTGVLRYHQFRLANVRREGKTNMSNQYEDIRMAYVFAPSFGILYRGSNMHWGIVYELYQGFPTPIPALKEYTVSFVSGFHFNSGRKTKAHY